MPTKCTNAQTSGIAVFYLLRAGNPEYLYSGFIDSLRRHPAGMEYCPVLIQKGFAPGFVHPLTRLWPLNNGTTLAVVDVSDDGFDLTAYRKAAGIIEANTMLFFNSYSRILATDWLIKLHAAHHKLGPNSIVGATGSWESVGNLAPFPNIAIRTNAFMIERELFLSFQHPLNTKQDCNLFEAGPDSMSRRIMENGGKVAIVDRNGRIIEPSKWPQSGVFRSGNQEQLLIADNRTMDYQRVSLRRRTRRARLAFGEQAVICSQNIFSRWWQAIIWRLGWK
jgi:hypothetical protein